MATPRSNASSSSRTARARCESSGTGILPVFWLCLEVPRGAGGGGGGWGALGRAESSKRCPCSSAGIGTRAGCPCTPFARRAPDGCQGLQSLLSCPGFHPVRRTDERPDSLRDRHVTSRLRAAAFLPRLPIDSAFAPQPPSPPYAPPFSALSPLPGPAPRGTLKFSHSDLSRRPIHAHTIAAMPARGLFHCRRGISSHCRRTGFQRRLPNWELLRVVGPAERSQPGALCGFEFPRGRTQQQPLRSVVLDLTQIPLTDF
jgi:hypothetical protein